MMGWHGFPLGGFDVAGLLGIAAVVLLIWGRRLGMRRPAAFRRHHTTSSSALEVAKRRYARGEISRDEFLDIANDLYLTDSAYPEKPKRSAR